MNSPASGGGSAPDLPDYAPTTWPAQSQTGRTASPATMADGGNQDRRAAPTDRRWLVLVVVAVAQLMVVLDYTTGGFQGKSSQVSGLAREHNRELRSLYRHGR